MLNDAFDLQVGTLFGAATLVFLFAAPVILIAQRFDRRRLGGDLVWAKPLKFALSLALHFATFAAIAGAMTPIAQRQLGLPLVTWLSVAAGLFELGYISIQSWRGRPSHFNRATAWERTASMLMGLGAVIVLLPALVIGLIVLVDPTVAWSWSLRLGIAIGLIGGAGLTLATGMAMGAVASHFATTPPDTTRKMWLTGWSLTGADLRPSHFLAAHMMQIVPAVGLIATMTMPDSIASVLSVSFGMVWAIATAHSLRAALAGRALPSLFQRFAQA